MLKIVVPLLLLFSACQKSPDTITDTDTSVEKNVSNVSYGTDNNHILDMYLPAGRSEQATKAIILIHGGGWSMGDKNEFAATIPVLKKSFPGYAIFNLNYRLYFWGANKFPTQENDVSMAINYIYNNRGKFHISDKYIYIGTSAGAHLALLQGYKNTTVVKPQAIVDYYGPTDLVALYNENTQRVLQFKDVIGGTPAEVPETYRLASPVNYVTTSSPPTLILQGQKDDLVLPTQATLLYNKLQAQHVPSQLVMYPNGGHGFAEPDLSDSYEKVAAFIKANVK